MNDERSLLQQALDFAAERQITLPVFSDVALKLQKAVREESYDITEIEKAIDRTRHSWPRCCAPATPPSSAD